MGTTITRVGRIELERHDEIDLIVAAGRECKVSGHHTNDSGCYRVNLNLFANDVTCAAKTLLPETIGNDGDSWSVIAIFLFTEVATKLRWHSQHIDQAAGNSGRGDSK